jgi:hypothetical protein
MLSVIHAVLNVKCHKQTHYTDCHYAECCYAERRGDSSAPVYAPPSWK